MENLREPTKALLFLSNRFLEEDWGIFLLGHRGTGKTRTIIALGEYYRNRGYEVRLLGGGNLMSLAEELPGTYEKLFVGVPEAGSWTDYAIDKFLSITSQLITDRIVPRMVLKNRVLYVEVREKVAVVFPVQWGLRGKVITNRSRANLAQDRFVPILMANPPNRKLIEKGDEAVQEAFLQSLRTRRPRESPVLDEEALELILMKLGLTMNRAYKLAKRLGSITGEAAVYLALSADIINMLKPSDLLEDEASYRVKVKEAIILDTLINDPRSIRQDGRIDTRYLIIKHSTTIRTVSKVLEKLNELSSGILLRRIATPIVERYAEPLLLRLSGRIPFDDECVQKALELVTGRKVVRMKNPLKRIREKIQERRQKRIVKKYHELNSKLAEIEEKKQELLEDERRIINLINKISVAQKRAKVLKKELPGEYQKYAILSVLLDIDDPFEAFSERLTSIHKEYDQLVKREQKLRKKLRKIEQKLFKEAKKEAEKLERPLEEALKERKEEERVLAEAMYTEVEINVSRDTADSKKREYELDFTIEHLYLPADITDREIECIIQKGIDALAEAREGLDVLLEGIPVEDVNIEIMDVFPFRPRFEPRAVAVLVIKYKSSSRRYDADFEYDDCLDEKLRTGRRIPKKSLFVTYTDKPSSLPSFSLPSSLLFLRRIRAAFPSF